MKFEDLIGRKFVVTDADASAKHVENDIVTFDGSADDVKITCTRYMAGRYEDDKISDGTPEKKATYTITITEDKGGYQIQFTPASQEGSGGIGGSWTANDSPPGPDNG